MRIINRRWWLWTFKFHIDLSRSICRGVSPSFAPCFLYHCWCCLCCLLFSFLPFFSLVMFVLLSGCCYCRCFVFDCRIVLFLWDAFRQSNKSDFLSHCVDDIFPKLFITWNHLELCMRVTCRVVDSFSRSFSLWIEMQRKEFGFWFLSSAHLIRQAERWCKKKKSASVPFERDSYFDFDNWKFMPD